MEIYTFLRMGGTVDRISVLPASEDMLKSKEGDGEKPAEKADAPVPTERMTAALAEVLRRFEAFDVNNANCTNDKDKEHLLGVIEQGFGSFDAFNELVRHTFVDAAAAPLKGTKERKLTRRGSKKDDAEVRV